MTEWFEQWFGEEYLQLYPHRDADDAAAAVELIATVVPLADRRVLDLACGQGRHAAKLREKGGQVVGFDLSMPLLRRARHLASPQLALVRGDMRVLPFREHAFAVVVNLFTSFGYFTDDRQQQSVLRGVTHVLRPGGAFVLDYLNAPRVVAGLVANEERTMGNRRVAIERQVTDDGRFVVKQMHLVDDGRSFQERVRLYAPSELEQMIQDAGLSVLHRFGDYGGGPLTEASERAFLVAERA